MSRRSLFAVASVLSLAACTVTPPPPTAPGRAALAVTALPVTDPAALGDPRTRPLDPAAPAHFAIALKLGDQAGLTQLLMSLHDPRSPRFRQWLSPAQFGERFGVPAAVYGRFGALLAARGFEVRAYPDRLFIEATGTVAEVESFWGLRLVQAHSGDVSYRSYLGTPSLPAELAGWVESVHGLDTRPVFRRLLTVGGMTSFGPQDLRRYYDTTPLHAQGFAGQASKVAALGSAPIPSQLPNPADIAYFYSHVSDSTTRFVVDVMPNPNGEFDGQPGLRQELELDAEMSTVASPLEQSVTSVLAPPSEIFSTALSHIVNDLPDLTAVSVSFGTCEAAINGILNMGAAQTASNLISQGAAEGQAWFVASGDTGVDACANLPMSTPGVNPDFPADVPWVTGVGGTETSQAFDSKGAVTAWQFETTWNDGANGGAGGGGVSAIFPRPPWQVGPGTSSVNAREIPDIALMSGLPGVIDDDTAPGRLSPVLGTSIAAPTAAGIFALVNDYAGGCRLGSPNPTLYALGAAQADGGGPAVFHDITTGNISYNGVNGPAADAGYDEATGWGSLDVAALAAQWPPCTSVTDSGFPDAGLFDAGTRVPFDACGVLQCDGGTVCFTVAEGPSACELPCDGGTVCPTGQICGTVTGFGSACVPGCMTDSDCGLDAGQACSPCSKRCVPKGAPAAHPGDSCTSDVDCPTGGFCLAMFPGGFCFNRCSATAVGCTCDSTAVCEGNFCFPKCSILRNGTCRSGYVCDDPVDPSLPSDEGICFLPCAMDSDCAGALPNTHCNVPTGQCIGNGRSLDAGTPDAGPIDAGPPLTVGQVPQLLGPKWGCGCSGGAAEFGGLSLFLAAVANGLKARTRPRAAGGTRPASRSSRTPGPGGS